MPKIVPGSVLLACVIALTACGRDNDDGLTQEEQFTQLMQRPSEEQVVEQYQRMQQEITDKLSAAVGLPAWTVSEHTGGEALCGHQFDDLGVDAGHRSLKILGTAAPIPDEQWDQAMRIVEPIARDNGFDPPLRVADQPGNHLDDFKNAWGGRLSIGTSVHTSLSVRTGCHLTEEAKQRRTPTPLPEHTR